MKLIKYTILAAMLITILVGCGKEVDSSEFYSYCSTSSGWRYRPVSGTCPYTTDAELITACDNNTLCTNP